MLKSRIVDKFFQDIEDIHILSFASSLKCRFFKKDQQILPIYKK